MRKRHFTVLGGAFVLAASLSGCTGDKSPSTQKAASEPAQTKETTSGQTKETKSAESKEKGFELDVNVGKGGVQVETDNKSDDPGIDIDVGTEESEGAKKVDKP